MVTFTPSHIEAVKSRSTACRSVVYIHDLMNQEFFTLNSINKRFRAVIFNVSFMFRLHGCVASVLDLTRISGGKSDRG